MQTVRLLRGGRIAVIVGLIILALLLSTILVTTVWNMTLIDFLGLQLPRADFWAGLGIMALLLAAGDVVHGTGRGGKP